MLIASTVMSTGYSPSLFAGQRGKSGFRPSSFNFHSCWFLFFLTIHNDCLCCVGFLPAEHSTKDPVPAVHQEPAVLHSAHQSEPMPILSTEEVHRRRNEPRRSVSLIVFFFLILRKIRAVKGYSPTAASSRRSLMTPLYGALTSLESELCAETRL